MAERKKKTSYASLIQTGIGLLAAVLAALIVVMMYLVSGIQGTARVVNYAGLVRGKTQRIVKLEIAGQPEDEMLRSVESFIAGLRYGDEELSLVRLDDEAFQNKMEELDRQFVSLEQEIQQVRQLGYAQTEIIPRSEEFFNTCDEATGLAEAYSQRKASSLSALEKYITADIAALMLLIGFELFKALRYAAMNRALQSKVYLDEATGLPNKNKCEELLSAPEAAEAGVGVCSFDLNNLRRINNSMGHEAGDLYIRRFAAQLRAAIPQEHFVGRDGGDEFIAITRGLDRAGMDRCLRQVRAKMDAFSRMHPEMPISYAVGYALADDFEGATMRMLFSYADKNMYINKNHVKREEAEAEKQLNLRLLRQLNGLGRSFSDCLYCDAQQDTYRLIRAGEACILAADGSYSGAVEQLVEEQVDRQDRARIRRDLQLETVAARLNPESPEMELQYRLGGGTETAFGRLTLLFIDQTGEGKLYHFLLAYEALRGEARSGISARQQLTQYYEQLKQSVLENDSYVDALLETADAVYAVDLTHDVLERSFVKKDREQVSGSMLLDIPLPGPYREYCARYAEQVTPETVESYRLTDTPDKLLSRFRSGSKQFSVEYSVRGPQGIAWVQKTVLMTESAVYDSRTGTENNEVHGMILLRDTTQFHLREQQEHDRLQAAYDQLTSANRAKTEFLSRMSHDIRTPINGVMGMLAMIRKNRDDQEKVDACLEKIQISSEHLLSLINDVLDMSKLESGHLELERVPFDLTELLNRLRALEDSLVDTTGLTLRAGAYDLEHSWVMGSPLHLRQILLNLFSNAVKYNRPGGSIETGVRELSCDGTTAVYSFHIRDTGIGMSRDFVEHSLFQPFTQEKQDARTSYQGTGLGMAIVKELVDRMNGSIAADSAPGEGMAFTIRLPFPLAEPQAERETESVSDAPGSLKGLRALLVEDNEVNMEIAEFFLSDLGLTVKKAWNGQEALDAFAVSPLGSFDVIFMDVMMPVMDGLEATRRIRALDRPDAKTVPILAMTANAFAEDAAQSRQAGMNEHLAKPLNEETVRAALLRCLAGQVGAT